MPRYRSIAPIPSDNTPNEWTFQIKDESTGKVLRHEDLQPGRTFTTRNIAKAQMYAFVDSHNLGLDIA